MTLVRVSATGMCKPCGNIQRVFVDGEWRECQDCAGKEAGMTTRDEAEERRLVDQLRAYQLEKLAKYRGKGHWGEESLFDLIECLRWEVSELIDAIVLRKSAHEVALEAADVANFAAMIADVALAREGNS